MCGIAGWLGPGAGSDPGPLDRMLATLNLRGPDQEGRYEAAGVALGMRRLAVLDFSGGRQPLVDQETGARLFYNGELYNHRALRSELSALGRTFEGSSDSEVLLQAWHAWGEDCLQRLNGMFAFALWQPATRTLFLARDRLGQKPLYYWSDARSGDRSTFLFGSELRTLLAHPRAPQGIDRSALAEYLRLRYVPCPLTIISGIAQLPPASLLTWRAATGYRIRSWWRPTRRPDPRIDLQSAAEEFDGLWPAVIRRHLISDVPVGAFVSGGIDSGLVAAEAARQRPDFRTFSISFRDPAFDETRHALATAEALGCRHQVFAFDDPFETLLEEWVRAYDQPFADPAAFPTLVLARESRQGVTVALTGDGGDELFVGYQRYRSTLLARRLIRLPKVVRRSVAAALGLGARTLPASSHLHRRMMSMRRRLDLIQPDVMQEYIKQFALWEPTFLDPLLAVSAKSPELASSSADSLSAMLDFDLNHWLPDQMLMKTDRATMAYSLEARLPFLDNEIVDLALRIPLSVHLRGRQLKRVLRKAAARHLPERLTKRPKQGFGVPVDRLLRDNRRLVEQHLFDHLPQHSDLFKPAFAEQLWQEHVHGQANHGERLLALLLFLLWSARTR